MGTNGVWVSGRAPSRGPLKHSYSGPCHLCFSFSPEGVGGLFWSRHPRGGAAARCGREGTATQMSSTGKQVALQPACPGLPVTCPSASLLCP